jgi:hypothetical protein
MSLVSLSIDRCTLGAIAAFFGAGKARLTFFAARGFLTAAMGAGACVDFAAFFAVAMRNFLHEKSLVRRTDIGSDSEIVQQLAMKIVRALPRLDIVLGGKSELMQQTTNQPIWSLTSHHHSPLEKSWLQSRHGTYHCS